MTPFENSYKLGEFAASTMLKGHIQPDFKLNNTGFDKSNIIFIDYADMFICKIPDDLNEILIRRLNKALSVLVRDSLKNNQDISWLRAGFIARGGLLADMLWINMANNGFSSLSYYGICKKPLRNVNIDNRTLEMFKEQIWRWNSIPLDEITIRSLPTLSSYYESGIREKAPLFALFYLDRLYYSRCYSKLVMDSIDQIPILIMNMGITALQHNHKYCAFGLLRKSMAMATTNYETYITCRKAINKLVQTQRLVPELMNLIFANIKLPLFDFLWLLNDIDVFEDQLYEHRKILLPN